MFITKKCDPYLICCLSMAHIPKIQVSAIQNCLREFRNIDSTKLSYDTEGFPGHSPEEKIVFIFISVLMESNTLMVCKRDLIRNTLQGFLNIT